MFNISRVEVYFYCEKCEDETLHEVIYLEGKIERISCEKCGKYSGMNYEELYSYYKGEVVDRLVSKPHRISDEMKLDLLKFIKTIPKRAVTKPSRIMKEIKEIKDTEDILNRANEIVDKDHE